MPQSETMNRIAQFCALIVVIVVSACSTGSSRYGEAPSLSDYSTFFSARASSSTIPAPDQPHGYLLASIGMGKGHPFQHGRFELWFRRKGEPWQTSMLFDNRMMLFYPPMPGLLIQPPRIEFLDGPKEVAVVVLPFTPGEYELFWYEYRGSQNTVLARPKSEFSIPFTIAPQTTTYLGEYVLWETVKDPPTRRLFGTIRDNRFIAVTDSFQRDFDSAEQAGRGLKGTRVLPAVPRDSLPEGFKSTM
jgi:hypothetical protein